MPRKPRRGDQVDGPQIVLRLVGDDNVRDGTPNTIALVEAKRDTPWTKPEDIPFQAEQPLPKLGGWHTGNIFIAAFGDGSVQAITNTVDEKLLRGMLSRNGGEPVSRN